MRETADAYASASLDSPPPQSQERLEALHSERMRVTVSPPPCEPPRGWAKVPARAERVYV